jgi:hypothetical protein
MNIKTLGSATGAAEFRNSIVRQTGVTLGPFTVDARGMLSPSSRDMFPAFTVQWRSRAVRARLVQQGDDAADNTANLEFAVRLGRIPSSAASPAHGNLRSNALQALRRLPALAPPGWHLHLKADHTVEVTAHAAIILPVSAISLVTEVTLFLLGLNPYLMVLGEEGVGFSGAGIVKI